MIMKIIACDKIECCNDTHQGASCTDKQMCACASDLGDASRVTCLRLLQVIDKLNNFLRCNCSRVKIRHTSWNALCLESGVESMLQFNLLRYSE